MQNKRSDSYGEEAPEPRQFDYNIQNGRLMFQPPSPGNRQLGKL